MLEADDAAATASSPVLQSGPVGRRRAAGRTCGPDADWLRIPVPAGARVLVWVGLLASEHEVKVRLVDAGGVTLASGVASPASNGGARLVHDVTAAGDRFVEISPQGGPAEYDVDVWALDPAACPLDGPYEPNDSAQGPWRAPARPVFATGTVTSAGFFNACSGDEDWASGDIADGFPSTWTVLWPEGVGTPEIAVFEADGLTPVDGLQILSDEAADGGRVARKYVFPSDRFYNPVMRVRKPASGPWFPVVVNVQH